MDLELALQGNLQTFEDNLVKDVRLGMRDGVRDLGELGKANARKRSQALGAVGMAWAYTLYPEGRGSLSDNPAVVIHPRGESAETILRAQARGETITARGARNLWIPVPGSPADRPKPRGQSLVKYMLDRVGSENIVIIPATANRPAMAIAKDASLTKTGRVGRGGRARTQSGAFRKGTADVPLFFLVPNARLEPSIDLNRGFQDTEAQAGDVIARALANALGRSS